MSNVAFGPAGYIGTRETGYIGTRRGPPMVIIVHFAAGASLAAARLRAGKDGGIVVNLADAVAGIASVSVTVAGQFASVYAHNHVTAAGNVLDWTATLDGVGVTEPQLDTYTTATQSAVADVSTDAPAVIDRLLISYFYNVPAADAWSETHAVIIPT